ncbi:hypothetical protein TNCV_3960341 [Trichonephila clavipes]|nr:hypothetical protein TNCV_3960341 [Trichonephila clavipes]
MNNLLKKTFDIIIIVGSTAQCGSWPSSEQFSLSPVPYPYGFEISIYGVQFSKSWSSSSFVTHRFTFEDHIFWKFPEFEYAEDFSIERRLLLPILDFTRTSSCCCSLPFW